MFSITEIDDKSVSMILDGDMTIYIADEFNRQLSECYSKYEKIEIDMSQVNELDTSCYQILLRARILTLKNQKQLSISNMSNSSTQVFDLYNQNDMFEFKNSEKH